MKLDREPHMSSIFTTASRGPPLLSLPDGVLAEIFSMVSPVSMGKLQATCHYVLRLFEDDR